MQIAVTPDPQRWVIIPPFPPPGWAREEARHRSAHLGVTGPQWRSELESLLNELQAMERQGASLASCTSTTSRTRPSSST